jgi:hypothetical protein
VFFFLSFFFLFKASLFSFLFSNKLILFFKKAYFLFFTIFLSQFYPLLNTPCLII